MDTQTEQPVAAAVPPPAAAQAGAAPAPMAAPALNTANLDPIADGCNLSVNETTDSTEDKMKSTTIDQLRLELADDEGCKYEIYLDHLNLPTFGIGHLIKQRRS